MNPFENQAEQCSCEGESGEKADGNTKSQGNGKALDEAGPKSGPEPEQDSAGNQRRNVRITDGRPGAPPAQIDCLPNSPAVAQFFLQPFEYKNIRIQGRS